MSQRVRVKVMFGPTVKKKEKGFLKNIFWVKSPQEAKLALQIVKSSHPMDVSFHMLEQLYIHIHPPPIR